MVIPYKTNPEIAGYWNDAIDSDNGIKITFDTPKAASRKRFQLYQQRKAQENQCAGNEDFLNGYRIPQMYDLIITQDGSTLRIAPAAAPGKVELL